MIFLPGQQRAGGIDFCIDKIKGCDIVKVKEGNAHAHRYLYNRCHYHWYLFAWFIDFVALRGKLVGMACGIGRGNWKHCPAICA